MDPEERVRQLRRAKTQIPSILVWAGMNATLRAVEKAVEETSPTVNNLCGTNTRTEEMKQHWATDSRLGSVRQGDSYVLELNNDKQYAPFVNDGYRMDRHFMPGLVIDPGSGLLESNLDGTGGAVVGIRTAYVPGLLMVDKAMEEYRRVLREGLKGLGELME